MELFDWLIGVMKSFDWLIGVIVGGVIFFLGNLVHEKLKRKQFKDDCKEGVITELLKILPELIVNHNIACERNKETIKWELSILSTLKEKYHVKITKSEELIDKLENIMKLLENRDIDDISYKDRSINGIFIKFHLSFLEERISFLSLFEKDFQHFLLQVRDNINHINENIDRYYYYKETYPQLIREVEYIKFQDKITFTSAALKKIEKLSYETAELIKNLLKKP